MRLVVVCFMVADANCKFASIALQACLFLSTFCVFNVELVYPRIAAE